MGADRKVPRRAEGSPGQADKKVAAIRQTIAAEVAKAAAAYDAKADASQGEVVQRGDYVWIDDAVPRVPRPRATAPGSSSAVPITRSPAGNRPCESPRKGSSSGSSTGRAKAQGRRGGHPFAQVFLDPLNPPKEIMLQWHTAGAWSHRAYWGENVIGWGKDNTAERLRIGDLPASGKWVRLEVEVKKLGLAPGTVIDGWAFTQHDGTVYWDRAGIETWTPQEGQAYDSLTAWIRAHKADGGAGLPDGLKTGTRDRAIKSEPRLRSRSCLLTLSSRDTPARDRCSTPARRAGEGRARAEARSTARYRRPSSSASGAANPSRRSCSTGANMTSGATRSAG